MKPFWIAFRLFLVAALAVPAAFWQTAEHAETAQAEQEIERVRIASVVKSHQKATEQKQIDHQVELENRKRPTVKQARTIERQAIPVSASLAVPFIAQAPHGNWAMPYQETCEEASALMVHTYLNGQTTIAADQADADLLQMLSYQERLGLGESITIMQLAGMIESYYGYQTEIIENPRIQDLKALIAAGNPIIVPAAGKLLNNPYFRGGGPWYHMLVVTGYDATGFITNDPGTQMGANYRYEQTLFWNAIHDWTGNGEDIESGAKRVLVVTMK